MGLAYLARPEGLAGALPLGLAVLAPALVAARRRRWRAAGRAGLPAAVAFAVPLLACVVPYALFLHDHTGAWALSAKANDASIEAWQAVARGDRADRDAVLYALDGSGLRFTAATSSLGALAREDPAGYAGVVATNVRMLARTLVNPDRGPLPSWQLLPAPVWALAGWGAWRMRRSGPMLVVLATGALPVATALAFFVQPRYLVVTAALAAVPVGRGAGPPSPTARRGCGRRRSCCWPRRACWRSTGRAGGGTRATTRASGRRASGWRPTPARATG